MFPDRLGGWPWMRIVFNASQVRRSLAEKRNRIVPIRGTLISLPFSSDFLRWAFSSPASSYPYPRKKCKVRRVEENSEGSLRLLSFTETSRHRFPSLWFLRKLIPISLLPDEWILILRFEQGGWYQIYFHRWFSRHFISFVTFTWKRLYSDVTNNTFFWNSPVFNSCKIILSNIKWRNWMILSIYFCFLDTISCFVSFSLALYSNHTTLMISYWEMIDRRIQRTHVST